MAYSRRRASFHGKISDYERRRRRYYMAWYHHIRRAHHRVPVAPPPAPVIPPRRPPPPPRRPPHPPRRPEPAPHSYPVPPSDYEPRSQHFYPDQNRHSVGSQQHHKRRRRGGGSLEPQYGESKRAPPPPGPIVGARHRGAWGDIIHDAEDGVDAIDDIVHGVGEAADAIDHAVHDVGDMLTPSHTRAELPHGALDEDKHGGGPLGPYTPRVRRPWYEFDDNTYRSEVIAELAGRPQTSRNIADADRAVRQRHGYEPDPWTEAAGYPTPENIRRRDLERERSANRTPGQGPSSRSADPVAEIAQTVGVQNP